MKQPELAHRSPTESSMLQTGINRGAFFYNTLMRQLVTHPKDIPIHLTLVGLGKVAHDLHCIYAPYRLIHDVLALGYAPQLTIVDSKPEIIELFLTQSHLYISQATLDNPRYRRDWQPHIDDYKCALHKPWSLIHAPQADLQFPPDTLVEACLARGIYQLAIPTSVLKFIHSPECVTVVSPYQTAPPFPSQAIELMNVLYQLNQAEQSECLHRVSNSLSPHGFCLLNDISDLEWGTRLFADRGGWLDKSRLPRLFGLDIDRCLDSTPGHEVVVLRKTRD